MNILEDKKRGIYRKKCPKLKEVKLLGITIPRCGEGGLCLFCSDCVRMRHYDANHIKKGRL